MLLYEGADPRRVIIYLAKKSLDVPCYELDYANGEQRSARYLAINPSGRAPSSLPTRAL